jgi:hypothetical protein
MAYIGISGNEPRYIWHEVSFNGPILFKSDNIFTITLPSPAHTPLAITCLADGMACFYPVYSWHDLACGDHAMCVSARVDSGRRVERLSQQVDPITIYIFAARGSCTHKTTVPDILYLDYGWIVKDLDSSPDRVRNFPLQRPGRHCYRWPSYPMGTWG